MDITPSNIAVFDSGIGGLTVLATCRKYLPNENFCYFGDNENAPYGNRTSQEIEKFVFDAFEELSRSGVKAAVLGCNTATAVCVEKLRKRYPFPIVGAEPALLPAAKRGGTIFVLATRATSVSERLRRLVNVASARYPNADIRILPCDRLAGMIEAHIGDESFDYVPYLPTGRPDAVVLGCTHYIYIRERIRAFYGVDVYDGNEGIARRLCSVLGVEKGQKGNAATGVVTFLGNAKNLNMNTFKQMFADFEPPLG